MHNVDLSSVTAPAPKVRYYTVKDGDTAYTIAQHFLGNSLQFRELLRVNGMQSPTELKSGMLIRIP